MTELSGNTGELPPVGSRWIRTVKNAGPRVGRTNLDSSSLVTVDAHEGDVVVFVDWPCTYREPWPPEGDAVRYEEVKP